MAEQQWPALGMIEGFLLFYYWRKLEVFLFWSFSVLKTSRKWRFSVFPLLNLPSHWVSIVIASSWVLRKDSPAGKYTQLFQERPGFWGSLLSVELKATFNDHSCFTTSSHKSQDLRAGGHEKLRPLYVIHGKHWDGVHVACLYVSLKVPLKKQRVALSPPRALLEFLVTTKSLLHHRTFQNFLRYFSKSISF